MDRARQLLRYHWISFGLVVTLSMISELFLSNYSSAWESYQQRSWHYAYMTGHITLFGVMVAATYFHRKTLWWVAIIVISLKLYRLLKYYAFFDYFSSSSIYNHDYWVASYKLGRLVTPWLGLPGDLLFSNNPLSAAFLTTLYVTGWWNVGGCCMPRLRLLNDALVRYAYLRPCPYYAPLTGCAKMTCSPLICSLVCWPLH